MPQIGSNSKMKGVLLALALPSAKAMGYATDGPQGIIYTSGQVAITDPVKYCSDAQRTSRSRVSRAHLLTRRRQRLHDGVEC